MEEIKTKLRELVQETLRDAGVAVDVTDDLSLVESGLLDSLSIISVVQKLQHSFDIDVGVADITVEVFDSIDAMAPFVAQRAGL